MSNYPAGSVVYVHKFSAELARAAGWRPPARVMRTVEELEALPAESIVQVISPSEDPKEPMAIVWVHESGDEWVEAGSSERHPAAVVDLPARLLWSPAEKVRPTE